MDLAIQAIASLSTAKSLVLLHQQKTPGFVSNDCLVTARFIFRNSQLWRVFNTKSSLGQGLSSPICPSNEGFWLPVLTEGQKMYTALQSPQGVPLYRGERKSGFLGILGNTLVIRRLVGYMSTGRLKLEYLLYYKACGDHVEVNISISTLCEPLFMSTSI